MKILIGSDHAAFKYKEEIIRFLKEDGYIIEDMGIYEEVAIKDYSIAELVGLEVVKDKSNLGILICGTGIGMSMSVNKIPGVRAALCHNLFTVEMSRLHNNSNILVFGSRVIDVGLAKAMVKKWLETEYEGGRHISRNDYIMTLDRKYRCNPKKDSSK